MAASVKVWGLLLLSVMLVDSATSFVTGPYFTSCPGAASRLRHPCFLRRSWHLQPLAIAFDTSFGSGATSPVSTQVTGEACKATGPSLFANQFAGRVAEVNSEEGWRDIQRAADEAGALLVAEFRAQFCRKCMALEGKYKRLPEKYQGRAVIFCEIDAQKVGCKVREEAGIEKVPNFQLWSRGKILDSFLAQELPEVMGNVCAMIDKHIDKFSNSGLHLVQAPVAAAAEVNEEEQRRRAADATRDVLGAWRKHQSRVVRAPGLSSSMSQSTGTLQRGSPSSSIAGGSSAQSERELKLSHATSVATNQKPSVQKPSGQASRGGGASREELLAQLEAIMSKENAA